jgi:hypothetical protein
MLFDHLVLSISPETRFTGIPELQGEHVVEQHHA